MGDVARGVADRAAQVERCGPPLKLLTLELNLLEDRSIVTAGLGREGETGVLTA
jgi:hypothetical protein